MSVVRAHGLKCGLRNHADSDAEPFEARFVDGAWSTSEIVAYDSDAALAALRADGLSIRQIAERSGRSKSAVDRRLKGGAS
jgi:hypothetical protein